MITVDKLNKLLENPSDFLSMEANELYGYLGHDFAKMKDFNQNNPHHCYDLLNHTIQTVLGLDKYCPKNDALPLLKVAALFHDIGKPSVVQEKGKNGHSVFYGHAVKSAEIASSVLSEIGYSKEATSLVLFYIAHHDDFISFKLHDDMPDKPNPYIKEINKKNVEKQIKSIIRKCKEMGAYVPSKDNFLSLLDLCCADASAQSANVVINGVCVDGSSKKIKRMKAIKNIIEELSIDKEVL